MRTLFITKTNKLRGVADQTVTAETIAHCTAVPVSGMTDAELAAVVEILCQTPDYGFMRRSK